MDEYESVGQKMYGSSKMRNHFAQAEPRALCIIEKHLHGLERVFVQIVPNQREFIQHIVRHGNHMAADRVRLKDVQQFAGAGPYESDIGEIP